MKTIILFKNNNLATMLYAAKLKINAIELCLSNLSCVYSLVGGNCKCMRLNFNFENLKI